MDVLILTIGLVIQSGLIAAVCVLALWRNSRDRDNVNLMRMVQDAHDRMMSGSWNDYANSVQTGVAARVQAPPPPVLHEDEIIGPDKETEDTVATFG